MMNSRCFNIIKYKMQMPYFLIYMYLFFKFMVTFFLNSYKPLTFTAATMELMALQGGQDLCMKYALQKRKKDDPLNL